MKRKLLRICHAIVRFDNIPSNVTSEIFSRTILPQYGDILEWEYLFSRYITVDKFEKKISDDIKQKIGKEIKWLLSIGHAPVLHVDYYSGDLPYIRFELPNQVMHKFVQSKRDIVLAFPSFVKGDELVIKLSSDFLKLLYDYKFSLEIV